MRNVHLTAAMLALSMMGGASMLSGPPLPRREASPEPQPLPPPKPIVQPPQGTREAVRRRKQMERNAAKQTRRAALAKADRHD